MLQHPVGQGELSTLGTFPSAHSGADSLSLSPIPPSESNSKTQMGRRALKDSRGLLWQGGQTHHKGDDRRLGDVIHSQGDHLLKPEKQGPGENHYVPTPPHPTEQQHPNTPKAGKQPPCRSEPWFTAPPSTLGPHHFPSTHPHCWCVQIRGISRSRSSALGREWDRGLFRAGHVPLPPMSESVCLPGRGGLELQGEQGQQV